MPRDGVSWLDQSFREDCCRQRGRGDRCRRGPYEGMAPFFTGVWLVVISEGGSRSLSLPAVFSLRGVSFSIMGHPLGVSAVLVVLNRFITELVAFASVAPEVSGPRLARRGGASGFSAFGRWVIRGTGQGDRGVRACCIRSLEGFPLGWRSPLSGPGWRRG